MTKYFFAISGFCAMLVWSASTSCSSKQVSVINDSSFASASSVLVGKCNKCHGDRVTANKFGKGFVINGNDSTDVLQWVNQNIDVTANYDSTDFGIIVNDMEGTSPHLMPLNGPKLSYNEIQAVKNWIWFHYSH